MGQSARSKFRLTQLSRMPWSITYRWFVLLKRPLRIPASFLAPFITMISVVISNEGPAARAEIYAVDVSRRSYSSNTEAASYVVGRFCC